MYATQLSIFDFGAHLAWVSILSMLYPFWKTWNCVAVDFPNLKERSFIFELPYFQMFWLPCLRDHFLYFCRFNLNRLVHPHPCVFSGAPKTFLCIGGACVIQAGHGLLLPVCLEMPHNACAHLSFNCQLDTAHSHPRRESSVQRLPRLHRPVSMSVGE